MVSKAVVFFLAGLCVSTTTTTTTTGFTVNTQSSRSGLATTSSSQFGSTTPRLNDSKLYLFNFLRRNNGKGDKEPEEEKEVVEDLSLPVSEKGVINTDIGRTPMPRASSVPTQQVDIVIIGGGVSGLAAAMTANGGKQKAKTVLLEAGENLGGRVQSDKTEDGYTLDHGFAVFIEEYPTAKELLDYEGLKLKPFLPGALVKLKGRTTLARVADPLRQPGDIFAALAAPVGSIFDKIGVVPLVASVRTKTIEEIFEQRETDTLTALKEKWEFGEDFINKFFKPFLEGIYLAPLQEQSSRMFNFVFKMFSEGSATLPEGGMGAVADQLAGKVKEAGVDIRLNTPVSRVELNADGTYYVESADSKSRYLAKSVIVATDGKIAQKLLSTVDGFESLGGLPEQPQRSVGCMYYSFSGKAPVEEPILILNGFGEEAGNEENPANNVCFPSQVNKGYAPEGYGLCSVTILSDAMETFKGREMELDAAVRKQLGNWFPEYRADIKEKWELEKIYNIKNAQPGQLKGPFPANVHGGRNSNTFRGKELPEGLFVCGDHMATATLNGALESGVGAGKVSAKVASQRKSQTDKVLS